MKDEFPSGWDKAKLGRVINHYESRVKLKL